MAKHTFKTPEEIAHETVELFGQPVCPSPGTIRDMLHAAIEADRAQRATEAESAVPVGLVFASKYREGQDAEPNPILVDFREDARVNWEEYGMDTFDTASSWIENGTIQDIFPDFDPDFIEHADRVIRRIRALGYIVFID